MREQPAWAEHAAFMNALAASRFIVLGGPLGNGERVLHIVEARSERVIRERLAEDPWKKMSLLRAESVEPWNVLLDRNAQAQPRAANPSPGLPQRAAPASSQPVMSNVMFQETFRTHFLIRQRKPD